MSSIYTFRNASKTVVATLIIPYKVAVKFVVPSVKAMLANELLKTKRLNQMQVAKPKEYPISR